MLQGEYGFDDICLGVPVVLGKNGIEEIINLKLNNLELANMKESADGVQKVNDLLEL